MINLRSGKAAAPVVSVQSRKFYRAEAAWGKLGWPLRRIEQATGVRWETAGDYLKAEGIPTNPPGWRRPKPAIQVATEAWRGKTGP